MRRPEVRGEFSPIKTKVPGIEVCELFPKMAAMMDKFTIVRSIVGSDGQHASYQCFTGRPRPNSPPGGWPSMGAVVSKLQGPVAPDMPAFVGLSPKMGHPEWADPGHPGFLGPAHAPFNPNGGGATDMVLKDISLERLNDRRALLSSFDNFRRECDAGGGLEAMDTFTKQAFGVLTSSSLADALNLEKEDPKTRDRYGRGTMKCRDDGGPECPEAVPSRPTSRRSRGPRGHCRLQSLGLARRQFQTGARMFFRSSTAASLPWCRIFMSADWIEDVAVVVWGEFGRTPEDQQRLRAAIIGRAFRARRWRAAGCAMARSSARPIVSGGEAIQRPVDFQEVFATLYHHLGIDIKTATVD